MSGLFEFKPAADASGYQTMTVTFDNPGNITSLDIDLFNATPGRALHLKAISINGVAVGPDATTNASSPGTFDLYVRSIHFDAHRHQDWFFGATADNDRIDGGPGNDVITGGIGNDVIDGGQGTDTAVFAGNITDYNFSIAGSTIAVTDHVASRGGTDVLTNIEFLKFADTTVNVLDITVGGQTPDGAGHITVRHADGSRDVYTSGVTGKDYVSQHTVMDSRDIAC